MSWLNILKKNDVEFQTSFVIKEEEKIEIKIEEKDPFIKDFNEEFDKIYSSKITEIKFEFKEYIEEEGFPLFNERNDTDYTFYDFIKENSYNFGTVKESVEIENEEYLESLIVEDNEYYDDTDYYQYLKN